MKFFTPKLSIHLKNNGLYRIALQPTPGHSSLLQATPAYSNPLQAGFIELPSNPL